MTNGAPTQTGGLGQALLLAHNAQMPCLPTSRNTLMRPEAKRSRGFTLLELLIAVVVVGVLAALAFPSYKDSIRKSRRSDAVAGIATVQQAQERHRANSTEYGDLAALTGVNATTSGKHYLMTMISKTATGYEVHATAQGDQADDTKCKVMGVRLERGALRYGSGPTGVDWTLTDPDSGKCWAK